MQAELEALTRVKTMNEMVEILIQMGEKSGGAPAPIETAPAPVAQPAAPAAAPAAPAAAAPAPTVSGGTMSREEITQHLFALIAERTGCPADMLDL